MSFFVYKFLTDNQEVIYIGRTGNLKGRIRNQHFSGNGHLPQDCYRKTSLVLYSKCLNEDDAKIKERYLINTLQPVFNRKMNSGSVFNFVIDDFDWRYIPFSKVKADSSRSTGSRKASQQRVPRTTPVSPLVHIHHRITLRQYKLWVCLVQAYKNAVKETSTATDQGYFRVPNKLIVAALGYEPSKKDLSADLTALASITAEFPAWVCARFAKKETFILDFVRGSTWVGIVYPTFVFECIDSITSSIIDSPSWTIFNSFAGKYESILYKLCADYADTGETPYMTVSEFRDYIGLDVTEYPRFKDLNKFALAGPINKINGSELADIEVSTPVDFAREGRKVAGFKLHIKKLRSRACNA